ncbi:MAG: hypothetical protein ACLFWH_15580, partial [Actinomycetota bacterium]
MSEKKRGIRNWTILIAVSALLAFSGLALAQETQPDNEDAETEGEGPPWTRDGFEGDWTPGTPGPPPWAGQDDEEDDGKGPPWLRDGFEGDWTPGTPGPPPW